MVANVVLEPFVIALIEQYFEEPSGLRIDLPSIPLEPSCQLPQPRTFSPSDCSDGLHVGPCSTLLGMSGEQGEGRVGFESGIGSEGRLESVPFCDGTQFCFAFVPDELVRQGFDSRSQPSAGLETLTAALLFFEGLCLPDYECFHGFIVTFEAIDFLFKVLKVSFEK